MNTNVKNNDVNTLAHKLIAYLRVQLHAPLLGYSTPLIQLQGGYETSTYRFELKGSPDNFARPLVLRLYPLMYGTNQAVWESTIQNSLAEVGYPVAHVYLVCTDTSILGGSFFIMDYLPGQLLVNAPPHSIPELLGRTHAELHNIDPTPLIHKLMEQGIDAHGYGLDSRFKWLREKGSQLPWIRSAVQWLLSNRPPEPARLSICHGDFHVLNILYADGKITGVLDWPGFVIADAALDIAHTIMLMTIPSKHLAISFDGLSAVDWDHLVHLYLAAYQTQRPINTKNLDYYQVRRCVMALIEGSEGQKVWQHPLIVQDLLTFIHTATGIWVNAPV